MVNINNIAVLDNPTAFTNPFQFEVTFECLQELKDGINCYLLLITCTINTNAIFNILIFTTNIITTDTNIIIIINTTITSTCKTATNTTNTTNDYY